MQDNSNQQENKYTILSWNVNRYDDNIHSYLKYYLSQIRPDILFLSETKIKEDKLKLYFEDFIEYNYIINCHVPAHYHGCAFLIRNDHIFNLIDINLGVGVPTRKDNKSGDPCKGRIISFMFNNKFTIVGTYVPNSGMNDEVKYDYRVNIWDTALYSALNKLKESGPVIWIGDINVSPEEIDMSHPKTMIDKPGCTLLERLNFSQFIKSNLWVDIWRRQNPGIKKFTWLRYQLGMRLDNIVISNDLMNQVGEAFMLSDVRLSDHVPIGFSII